MQLDQDEHNLHPDTSSGMTQAGDSQAGQPDAGKAAGPVSAIEAWVREKSSEPGLEAYFPILIQVSAANKVEVFLDGDEGIDLDTCRRFSRFLEEKLDESNLLGPYYSLEVSSPGATRPLLLPRQYPKHKGRTLEVRLLDERRIEGKLLQADASGLTLEVVISPKGRKKETAEQRIAFSELIEAKVKITFK